MKRLLVAMIVTLSTGLAGAAPGDELQGGAPGRGVTLWWVVFNQPEHCATSPCGEPDLFNPDVRASVIYATGQVSRPSGRALLTASLYETDTEGFADVATDTSLLGGPGLLDSQAAEIHLVVRDHGPVIPGIVADQISIFEDPGCQVMGGPNDCVDVQASIYLPNLDGEQTLFWLDEDFTDVDNALAKLIRLDGATKVIVTTDVTR